MQTPKIPYTFDYQTAVDIADTQMSVYWTADEIHVEKDVQDIKVNMTEAESHGVLTALRLFTLYEIIAGDEYWGGRFKRMFPRHDLRRMANAFSFFEINIHAPFYNKLNEALMVNTDEFYLSYLDDPLLTERMDFIDEMISQEDDLLSIAAFSMVEGAVLYSAFAFLLHFQAKGKNKLKNVCSGIKFSVRDENLHAEGGAWAFQQLMKEKEEAGLISAEYKADLQSKIYQCAEKITEHEFAIVDKIFERGEMAGITPDQMKEFIGHRVRLCLSNLGYTVPEKPKGVVEGWFYNQINALQFHDFFAGQGNEYNRNWTEEKFTW